MLKKLLIGVALLVVLLVAGVVIAFLSIDSIARSGIQKGGTYALGVPVKVSGVSVGVFKGEFSMSGLDVANPSGFAAPHFLTLDKGDTAVTLSTLRQPTVEIPTLTLAGLDVNLENKGGGVSNYGVIMENLKKVAGGGSQTPSSSSGEGKKFVIRSLVLRDITIKVDAAGLAGSMGSAVGGAVNGAVGNLTRVTIPIEKIELKDVGKGQGGVGDSGVTMEQLSAIIVKAVLAAAAEKGGGLIPSDLLGDLRGRLGDLANLDGLSKGGAEIIAGARGKVEEIGKKVQDEVKKGVEDAAKGVEDALKGVLGGKEKK